MVEGSRRKTIQARRRGASIVLAAIGVFVICGGVGKADPTVAAIGLAIVTVAGGIPVLARLNRRTPIYVSGSAHVVRASPLPAVPPDGRCTMDVLITAKKMAGIPAKIRDPKVPVNRWPYPGMNLPIVVPVDNPRKAQVMWDAVPPHGQEPTETSGVRGTGTVDDETVTYFPGDLIGFDDETDDGAFAGEPGADVYVDVGTDTFDDEATVATGRPVVGIPMARVGDDWRDVADVNTADVASGADRTGAMNEGRQGGRGGTEFPHRGTSEGGGSGSDNPDSGDAHGDDGSEGERRRSRHPGGEDAHSGVGDDGPDGERRRSGGSEGGGLRGEGSRDDGRDGEGDDGVDSVDTDDIDDAFLAALGVIEMGGRRTIELDVRDPNVVRWSAAPAPDSGIASDSDAAGASAVDTTDAVGAGGASHTTDAVGAGAVDTTNAVDAGGARQPADAVGAGATDTTNAVDADAMPTPRRRPSPRPRTAATEARPGVPGEDPPTADVDRSAPASVPPVPAQPNGVDVAGITPTGAVVNGAPTGSIPTVPIRFHQARVVSPGVAAPPDDPLFDQAADEVAVSEAYIAATPPPGAGTGGGKIRSVAATLFVTDLSRSIIFYRDVLGFTETDAGRGSAVLVSGDARIVLRRVAMAPVDRRLVQLLLEVPDVDAAYEDLRGRSVPFIHRPRKIGQYEQQTLWAAALRDPDGHAIAITEWRDLRD